MNAITEKLTGEQRQAQHMAALQVSRAKGITIAGAVDEIHADPAILDELAEHAKSLGGGADRLGDELMGLKSAIVAAKPAAPEPTE